MILYHGTSTKNLPLILKEGLHPRKKTKHAGNWNEGKNVPAKRDVVYLTTAYPVYYAIQAAAIDGSEPVVLEVEANPDKLTLYPDEDFIAFCLHIAESEKSLKDHTEEVDLMLFQDYWLQSLDHSGCVATDYVPLSMIRRHHVLKDMAIAFEIGGEDAPTPLGFAHSGKIYTQCMAVLMDEGEEAAQAFIDVEWEKQVG